jgi:uncharacterized protein YjbI with pentapeptide repeats
MGKKIFVLSLVLFLNTMPALAYNQADLDRLLATGSCPHGNLTGAQLANANLTYADLTGADLSFYRLRRGYFGKCLVDRCEAG